MPTPHRAVAALAGLTLLLAACEPLAADPPDTTVDLPPCEWVEVDRVVDGDTLVVLIDGDTDRVRLTGIDTPETVAPDQPVEPYGLEASALTRTLLEDGWVCLERDISDRDRFDRLLRYGWLEDGRMLNEELLRAGLANVVTFPPDVKYHETRLLPAQDEARAASRGIWSQ
ncbi:MAG TPA: thermonuclease family protein [Tepidiformaceae bacterium]|nr:thermonuclease family protein [Tepidiformaceae bacterium]